MVPRRKRCATCDKLISPLHERHVEALEAWARTTMTESVLENALSRATSSLTPLTKADRSSVLVPIGRGSLRVLASSEPWRQGDLIISLERYPELQHLLATREPILVADASTHELLRPVWNLMQRAGIVSIAAVTFQLADVTAVLRMVSRSRSFTPHDLHLLDAAGHLAEHRFEEMAQQELPEDSSSLELILALADAVVDTALDGRVVATHGPLQERLGWEPDDLIGAYLDELLVELHAAEARRRFVELLDGQTTRTGQIFLTSVPGRPPRRIQVWGRRKNGPGLGARIAIRKVGGDTLLGDEVFQRLPVPLLVVERSTGHITAANAATEELLSADAGELVGSPAGALMSGNGGTARVRLKDGRSQPVHILRSPTLPDEAPETMLALLASDAHAQVQQREAQLRANLKRQMDEIESLQERFEELETIRTQFLATSAHELKTPLTVIQSYLEILLTDLAEGLSEEQLSFLEITFQSVLRLRRLVVDMIDLAAIEGGKIQMEIGRVELHVVISEVMEEMAPVAQRAGVHLEHEPLHRLPAVRADGSRVAQVARNLVDNALKHTPPEGSILVTGHSEEDSVVLEVRDSGEGIPADKLATVFEEFTQVNPARDRGHEGAGLGLTICRRIMRALGGRISVSSTEGAGSIFAIHLPQWPEGDDQGADRE